jgi:valyl-tRNA synthetase
LVALHPVIPFITEEIWQQTKDLHKHKEKSISLRNFPKIISSKRSFKDIALLKNSIVGIRNLRAEMQLSPKIKIDLILTKKNITYNILNKYKTYLSNLCGVKNIIFSSSPPPSSIVLISDEKLFVPLKGLIDPNKEIARNSENLNKLNKNFESLKLQLQNKKFIKNAPKLLVKERKMQLKDLSQKISKTRKHLKVLEKV